jgi:hypothetical protein
MENDQMTGARTVHGRHEKCMQSFDKGLKEETLLEDPGAAESIILKWVLKIYYGRMYNTGFIRLNILKNNYVL